MLNSILPIQPDQLALNPHPVRRQDADFIGGVGGLQRDRGAAAAEALQGSFLLVDQGDHDVAGLRRLVALDQRHVAVEDAGIHHGVATHFERVVLARAEHVRRHADGVAAGLQRLDRRARRDTAHHRYRYGAIAVVLRTAAGRGTDLAEIAFDDARGEAATAVAAAAAGNFRQLDDLDGAGAIGQATDEAALFQRRDQAVDAGLGAQIQRILHFVEGGGNAGLFQPLVDESQEFILFAREHLDQSPVCKPKLDDAVRFRREPKTSVQRLRSARILETNHERTLYVPYVFRNHLISRQQNEGFAGT